MTLPNFIGIGAQRSATTWIYNCLREHPEVYVPEQKELRFFSVEFEKGISWYEGQFRTHTGQKAIGEITPHYLHSEKVIPRMAQIVPHARLFVILREPVQRAFSAYKLLYKNHAKGLSFREACERSSNLIPSGLYTQHLERVFAYYDRSAVKIFLYDDIQSEPTRVLAELFSFLQVDPDFRPRAMDKVYNKVVLQKTQNLLMRMQLNWVINMAKKTPMGEWAKKRDARKDFDELLVKDEELASRLKKIFHDDIIKLQDLIQRDLSNWL